MAHEKRVSQPDHEAFCYQVAWYYCGLTILHPLRDGNGRALRILFKPIILHAGYQVRWEGLSASDWLAANIAGD